MEYKLLEPYIGTTVVDANDNMFVCLPQVDSCPRILGRLWLHYREGHPVFVTRWRDLIANKKTLTDLSTGKKFYIPTEPDEGATLFDAEGKPWCHDGEYWTSGGQRRRWPSLLADMGPMTDETTENEN